MEEKLTNRDMKVIVFLNSESVTEDQVRTATSVFLTLAFWLLKKSMEFITTQRNGRLLVLNNCCFRTKGKNKDTEYFTCIEQCCGVRVRVVNGNCETNVTHNHEDHYLHIQKKKFKSDLKSAVSSYFVFSKEYILTITCLILIMAQVSETPTASLKQTYDRTANKFNCKSLTSPEAVQVIGQFSQFKSSMDRVRCVTRPTLPTTLADIVLEGSWTKTTDNR